jgi:hypothetical protein
MKRTILFYYAPIIITAMIIGALYPPTTSGAMILGILFLPVATLLWISFFKIKNKNLATADQPRTLFDNKKKFTLLLYSTLLSLVIFIGAFFKVTSFKEVLLDILFIPVMIQLLLWFVPFLKSPKKVK